MKYKVWAPTLAVLAALCVPGTALAAEWTPDMFTWDEAVPTKITGLSAEGIANIAENKALEIPATNADGQATTEIGNMAFYASAATTGPAYSGEDKAAIATITSVTMPDTITTMGTAAFINDWNLTSVKLSEGLTAIPASAFLKTGQIDYATSKAIGTISDYAALEEVVIPSKVTSIGASAFSGAKVKKVVLPDSLTDIGGSAFLNNQLSSVAVPAGVKSLGTSAFAQTNEAIERTLVDIKLNEGLTSIGSNAFRRVGATQVQIPTTVTTLNKGAFTGCTPMVTALVSSNAQLTATKTFITEGAGHVVKGDASKVTLDFVDAEATGSALEPTPAVTFDDAQVDPANFTYVYQNNVLPGTATVTATAAEAGSFVGTVQGSFVIALSADDQEAVDGMTAAIASLPATDQITADNAQAVSAVEGAVAQYLAMSDVQKSQMGTMSVSRLLDAQAKVTQVKQELADAAAQKAKEEAEAAAAESQKQLDALQDQLKDALSKQVITSKAAATVSCKAAKSGSLKGKLSAAKAINLTTKFNLKAKTALSFSRASVAAASGSKMKAATASKYLTVSKAGKLTAKKGLAKGSYKVKVKVVAAATADYKQATKTVTVTVKVK